MEERDPAEQAIVEAVKEHGWFVALFEATETEPSFGYTIGLWKTFKHPEIVIFGLDTTTMHTTLNAVGERIRNGEQMQIILPDPDVFEGRNARFVNVPETYIQDYFGYGMWFNDYKPFSVLQLAWPDRKGLFPWEEGSDPVVKSAQPILSDRLK